MYLKIKGNLNDDYTVEGVLTDKTSPLQPIGNTRRLNDFDRVMVAIDGPALNAVIGDIDLRLHNGKFGKLDRSIEGISFRTKSRRGGISGALGFSYGKYHLLQIRGKNGKQGPYRLSGRDGEKFIIVLAGSEKIRLDDRTLVRGEEHDYIIDYNAAEIHFTHNNILSSNSRISVEFEYVPDIYLSSYSFGKQLISGEVALGNPENSPIYISAGWQDIRDDQNNPLGDIEANQLQEIFGDLSAENSRAEISTVVQDTLNGSYDLDTTGILIYRGEQMGAYSADFTYVGLEQGQYRKELSGSNAYYVYDPVLGEYIPARQYTAAQGLSVFSLTGHARRAGLEAKFDLGLSQENKNLYARKDDLPHRTAWDVSLGIDKPLFELRWGDKSFEQGYVSHDALESLEYYRKWQLSRRMDESEQLQYGHLRLGNARSHHFRSTLSQMERSGLKIGRQLQIDSKSDLEAPLSMQYGATITDLDRTRSQQHDLRTDLSLGKFRTGIALAMEEGSNSPIYTGNDHLQTGIEVKYAPSGNDEIGISYTERRDFPDLGTGNTILNSLERWRDLREDWSAQYSFSNYLDARGTFSFKYREHTSDSGAVNQYYLGKFDLEGQVFDGRLKYHENLLLDEEHIPKYDYHYIEVDTGYGDYSFDPAIQDYIPIHGGRFVRQRMFSDLEEQVRKVDNKTRLEFTSRSFRKTEKIGIRSRFGLDRRVKDEVITGARIQDQTNLTFATDLQTGWQTTFTNLNYSGRSTTNSSTLYNYGAEDNFLNSHDLSVDYRWSSSNQSDVGVLVEQRERTLEYNPLAAESWHSTRPYIHHALILSPQQKLEADLQYSMISDEHLSKDYSELFLELKHGFRYKRRGRLDQKLLLSRIAADVNAIPYSVFSGRQPGDNWKYSVNARYTFSSMFQISANYSLQKRGINGNEQYLRVEGRTHF